MAPLFEDSHMARQVKARRVARRKQIQPRDLWLAGIGALSLARKQAAGSYANLSKRARALRVQAGHAVIDSLGTADASLNQARTRLLRGANQAQTRALALLSQARSLTTARLAPVLARFGVQTGTAARKRKPAAKVRRAAPARARRKVA